MIKQRTCIACRNKNNKENLLRIVEENNNAVIDKLQKENKRGVYICNSKECIEKLLKYKSLKRFLKNDIKEESFKELLNKILIK